MKDEIKEILEELRKTADNTIFVICSSQEELDKIPKYTANFMSINDRKAKLLLDYITNLQQENERLKNEPLTNILVRIDSVVANIYRNNKEKEDYKSRCEKASEKIKQIHLNAIKYGANHDAVICQDLLNILQNGSDVSVKD